MPHNLFYFYHISNSKVSGDNLISLTSVRGRRLLGAFESSYKKRTYQDWFFKLRPGGSATQYFYDSSSVTWFPFRWSSFVTPSLQIVLSDFSVENRGHINVLEKLPLDIITLKLEGIGCTNLVHCADDLAILQECFCDFLVYWSFFVHLVC